MHQMVASKGKELKVLSSTNNRAPLYTIVTSLSMAEKKIQYISTINQPSNLLNFTNLLVFAFIEKAFESFPQKDTDSVFIN
jgi:hypothetical protein